MGAIDRDVHRPWLAYALEESLEHTLLTPKDVIEHANPEVLVTQLPAPVISLLLARALTMGTFSAAQVLESVPPALLAEHLEPEVMWRCLKDAAERGGLSRVGGARTTHSRQWFASVVGRALESGLVTPADVLRFLPPSEFAAAAPRPVMADLLKEALSRSKVDADLVLQHITPTVIAENLETSLVWDCLAEAAGRHFELGTSAARPNGTSAAKPAATMMTPPPAAMMPPPPSGIAASAKPAAKAPEKEKVAGERTTTGPDDKTPAPAFIGAANLAVKPVSGGPGSVRAEPVIARGPSTIPTAVAATPTARHDSDDWTPSVDDRRFPHPSR